MLRKVVGQELHCICSNDGYILVGGGIGLCAGDTESLYPVVDVLGDLHSNLETKHESVGKLRCQSDQETAKTASDIGKLWGLSLVPRVVLRPVYGPGRRRVVE